MTLPSPKIQPEHLQRLAMVYVRQSSLVQLQEHQESTRRQYDLQERAWQLGWPRERIVVVDADLGHSALPAPHRKPFKLLGSGRSLVESEHVHRNPPQFPGPDNRPRRRFRGLRREPGLRR